MSKYQYCRRVWSDEERANKQFEVVHRLSVPDEEVCHSGENIMSRGNHLPVVLNVELDYNEVCHVWYVMCVAE